MPAPRKTRVPSYRLHKPTGLAVVRLTGRDFYLGRYGSPESHDRYNRLIAEWLANQHQIAHQGRPSGDVSDITINELILAYWQHVEQYYVKNGRPSGEQQAMKYSLKPVAEQYGRTRVQDFSPQSLKAVRETMVDAGLVRTLINARIKRIRRMFKWGVENGLVPTEILNGLQAVGALKRGRSRARESEPVKPAPEVHVDAALPHTSSQVAAMIELQRLTGMRPGEVTVMRGCDLDTTGKIWIYQLASHKTDHHGLERIIYLGPKAQAVVKPFLKADLQAHLFSPKDVVHEFHQQRHRNRKTPMTPSQAKRKPKHKPKKAPGEHYTTESYGYAIRKACKKAGVPKWGPNQLRHNAATFLRKEFGIDAARVILGHTSPATTEVYAELDRAKAIEIMSKVG